MASERVEAVGSGMEVLLDQLGLGRWSALNIAVSCAVFAMMGMQAMAGAFMAPLVGHTCRLPPTTLTTSNNLSHTLEVFQRVPGDECTYLVNGSQGVEQLPCTEWDFDKSSFVSTITSEFSLVCGQAFQVPAYQALYMGGCGVGSLVGGILSDKFGRRLVVLIGLMLYVLMAACPSWLPSLPLIFTARFLLGVLHMIGMQGSYVLMMETIPQHTRAMAGIAVAVPWAVFMLVFSGLGYYFREWRHLQMVTSLPFILLLIPTFLFIDESPRWLMVKGRREAAVRVLTRAAAWHRVILPLSDVDKVMEDLSRKEIEKQQMKQKQLRNKFLGIFVLFRTPRLRLYTLVLCLNFFTASGVYFSLSLGAVNFSADPYIYMALNGVVEILSYTLMGTLLAHVGRKGPAIISFFITGFTVVILPFIPSDIWQLNMAVVLLGKMTISAVLEELFLYSSEVFPTEVRIQGLGTGLIASRLGSILSPFFNDLLVPLYPLAMTVVVGGLSLVAGLSTCLLPETKGAKLPNLIVEVEATAADYPHDVQMTIRQAKLQRLESRGAPGEIMSQA